MADKTDNRHNNNLAPGNSAAARHRRESNTLLQRIDELQDFYDFSPVGYLSIDSNGRILDVNLTAIVMLKVVKSELIGRSLFDHVVHEDRDILYRHLRRLFKSEKPKSCELRIQDTDKKMIHAYLDSIYAEDHNGRRICRSVISDISERNRFMQALQEREEQLRLAVEGARLGTWNRNLISGEVVWNRILYELLDRDPDGPSVTGKTFFEYIHPDDVERFIRHFEGALKNAEDFFDEFRIIRDDGEIRWLASSGRVFRNPQGRPLRLAGVNYDITERKEMEKQLKESHDQLEKRVQERTADLKKKSNELQALNFQLQNMNERVMQEHSRRIFLSKHLVDTLEKERREIAMALHDEAGQILTGLKMDLEMIETRPDSRNLFDHLHSAQGKLTELVDFIKNVSWKLRPSVLDTLGLLPALRGLVDDVKLHHTGIAIDLFAKHQIETLDREKQTALYRIVQEALNNCIKYAEAKEIFISLVKKNYSVLLTVEDDGRGFDYQQELADTPSAIRPLGITIMRERAVQQGGKFWIESAPGKGTMISVEIPI